MRDTLDDEVSEDGTEPVTEESPVELLESSVVDGGSLHVDSEEGRDVVSDDENRQVDALTGESQVAVQLDDLVEGLPLGDTCEDDDSRIEVLVTLEDVVRYSNLTIRANEEPKTLSNVGDSFLEADLDMR